MRTTHLFSLLCAGSALGLVGCPNDPTPEPEPLPLATSLNVTATLSFPTEGDPAGPPVTELLLLRLDDAADGSVVAVLASGIDATSAGLARTSAGLSLRESVELPVSPWGAGSFDARLLIESLELAPADQDGDGRVDFIEGQGSGSFSQIAGDVEDTVSFTMELSGGLDDRQPDLYLAATDRLHVLDGLTLLASEPLRLLDTAEISVGDKVIPLEMLPAGEPYFTRLHTRSILPFATEVVVSMDPEPRDLTGLGIELGLERIETIPDPGMFAEDGFEGALAALTNGVEVVTGVGTLPAISGTRSLLVAERWGTATMRVPLQEGNTHLRFEVRGLFDRESGFGCVESGLRVGFPALDRIQTINPAWNMDAEEDTGDERWNAATPVITVELALPEDAGSEVIFDIFGPPALPGPPCPGAVLLIDDLRAE